MEYKFSRYNIIKEHDNCKVLYNSYTKSSIFFEKDFDLSFVDNDSLIDSIDEEVKKVLIEKEFVIKKGRDELGELRYGFLKKYFDKSILTIGLIPSLQCNFKCPYCCEKPFTCGKENLSRYFNTLKEFSKKTFKLYNHIHINLFGGEPLLYYEYAKEYLDWLDKLSKKNGFIYTVAMVTNGSLITEEKIDFLIKHNMNLIQITLDSDKENHDKMRIFKDGKPSFDILVKKIDLVAKKFDDKKIFVLRINLNNTSVEKVEKSLNQIDKENRSHINLMFRVIYKTQTYNEENENKIDKLEDYIAMGKKLGFKVYSESFVLQSCEAATDGRTFYLLPNLVMCKCANELGHPACSFGKILENGDVELDYEKLVSWFNANYDVFTNEKCLNCKLLPDCLGGCPLYRIKNKERKCRSFDMVSLPNYYEEISE